jgi:hypothetical protein
MFRVLHSYPGLGSTQSQVFKSKVYGIFLNLWFFQLKFFWGVSRVCGKPVSCSGCKLSIKPGSGLLIFRKIACSNLETVVGHNPGCALGHGSEFLAGRDRVHPLHTRHHREQARSYTQYITFRCRYQCCGSASGLDPDSTGSLDPDSTGSQDPYPDPGGQK